MTSAEGNRSDVGRGSGVTWAEGRGVTWVEGRGGAVIRHPGSDKFPRHKIHQREFGPCQRQANFAVSSLLMDKIEPDRQVFFNFGSIAFIIAFPTLRARRPYRPEKCGLQFGSCDGPA